MRTPCAALCAVLLTLTLGACGTLPATALLADPASDAPEPQHSPAPLPAAAATAATYDQALANWRSADEVNAWIGAHFRYDSQRALLLSETQRQQNGSLPIVAPAAFFAAPSGVCVDLARFGVETLHRIDPKLQPRYLMIEFDPLQIAGNTLRRHWLVSFERDGAHYFFADSKRPGHIAGPYASVQAFVADYSRYRGRSIVSFSERASYQRQLRKMAVKQERSDKP